jgi:hypothetical protein
MYYSYFRPSQGVRHPALLPTDRAGQPGRAALPPTQGQPRGPGDALAEERAADQRPQPDPVRRREPSHPAGPDVRHGQLHLRGRERGPGEAESARSRDRVR